MVSALRTKDGSEEWGYVQVRPKAHMFWWLYRSPYRVDSPSKPWPIILWLQGGPGSSGVGFGNFKEIGPLDANLKPRNFTWLRKADLLFVDNPVGTGYSFVEDSRLLVKTDKEAATDLTTLITKLFNSDHSLQKSPLFIVAESYGGKFAVTLGLSVTKAIQKRKLKLKLGGVVLGDSWISPEDFVASTRTFSWGPLLKDLSRLDDKGLQISNSIAERIKQQLKAGQFVNATNSWSELEYVISINSNSVDFYNFLLDSGSDSATVSRMKLKLFKEISMRRYSKHLTSTRYSPGVSGDLYSLLNGVITKKLKIIPEKIRWFEQSDNVFTNLEGDFMKPRIAEVDKLLALGVNVTVYNGQVDLICATKGTEAWLKKLKWAGLPNFLGKDRTPIFCGSDRKTKGFFKSYKNLNFYWILGAGHFEEEFVMQLNKRVTEVKGLFVQEASVLQKLELADWIQKLGLANYFQKDINEFLESILVYVKNSNINPSIEHSLHVSALCFRLLRQHGYPVLPDTLSNFLDEKGKVIRKSSYVCYGKDVVELLEASHLSLEGEKILDEAKNCAINSLKFGFSPSSININRHSNLVVEKMVHALELPSHWRVQWFEVKWHVEQYKQQKNVDPILLELTKLNFNMIQAKLQIEVKDLSRWWENLGIKKELSFARNRLVESFMCAAGVAFEPKYKAVRKWLTKVIIFVLIIDDVYDIHASFEELKPFTLAFERWDDKELEELPQYMKICVHALKDVTNEIAYEIGGENNFHSVLPYLKKAWIDFCKALYVEAKWYNKGYIPSLEEYLSNAWISSSGPVILLLSYFATMNQAMDIDDFLHTYEDLVYNVSLIIRLCNDLGTTAAEREKGDVASSILCYMNQKDASEEKARKHIQDMIHKAWKKINGHYCSNRVASVEPFLTQAINAARVAHTLYQNGDGFGIQDRDIKKHILSLVVEPLR
ncbi:hypothetical protein JHK82_037897 [Glycine max]|nr:hypothetical protein JHK85_038650 [Glycine max]KAG4978617.1 hypothetical protein JHK86_038091 [Glycine max]KAG5114628.1 hypothetical protein JHK82_037897 [Glycine max]KAG5131911.1 hypothetical protein JHK84_038308 [Glycine max]